MNQDKIGKFIYELRTENKLSQYQLAEKIPISRQAVSKWERGQTIPDSSTLLRLSDIFDVTINELLKGERIQERTIEQLEKTTLNILDENNKKTKKIKRLIISTSTIIVFLIVSFLFYYFINSYNSIKVYKISTDGKNFDMYDGLFIITNQKSYFKIGKIQTKEENKINNIKLYYKTGNKKHILQDDVEIERIITNFHGYKIIMTEKDLATILENTYMEITYNNNKKETMKLNFRRDFINNKLFANKKQRKDIIIVQKKNKELKNINNNIKAVLSEEENLSSPKQEETSKIETIEEMMDKAIEKQNNSQDETEEKTEITYDEGTKLDWIVQNGTNNFGNYQYEIFENGNYIQFMYFKFMNQLIMFENNEIIWTYIHIPKVYKCEKIDNENPINEEDCRRYINKCLNNYIK